MDGVVSVTAEGIVNTSIPGTYTITYSATDISGNTATATRTITVIPPPLPGNNAPVADPDSYSLSQDDTISVLAPGVLGNDTDSDGDNLTVISNTNPSKGIVTLNSNGSFNYTPTLGFSGQDTFDYVVSDGNGGTDTATVTITVIPLPTTPDTTPPVITLTGAAIITLQVGDTYIEQGATATDDVDVNSEITARINIVSTVNTASAGSYRVTYNVSDAALNAAVEVTRTVNVTAPAPPADTTAPVITLLGEALVEINQDTAYIDAGASATDDVDGDLTSSVVVVNPVDITTLGTYTITYNVSDAAGNSAVEITRTVNVVEIIPEP